MNKRRWIAVATSAVLIVGVVVFVSTSNAKHGEERSVTSGTSNPATSAGNEVSPASTAPGITTTSATASTTAAAATEARAADGKEPVSVALRAPVRCSSDKPLDVAQIPGDNPKDGKRWVTVQRLDGSCDASSTTFSLRGIDTRLVWRSSAADFNAFLIDTKDKDAAAGFSDAGCAGPCSEYQSITSAASSYNLRVQADGGPWEVFVQEYR